MNKRYQIFVSSTFIDLVDERLAVQRAVLELEHMPAGMELFPPSDDAAWDLIKDVISSSDYYVLIIGGRYGSTDAAGLSYTEKEYEFAHEKKLPVIPLLHKAPEALPRNKTETDGALWERLKAFRQKIEKRHTCVYWDGTDDLKSKVILGLTSSTRKYPALGWVRSNELPTETAAELVDLRKKVLDLERALQDSQSGPPKGAGDLAQGDDRFTLEVTFDARPAGGDYKDDVKMASSISASWNAIFAAVAPAMIDEAVESSLEADFKKFFWRTARAQLREGELADHEIRDIVVKEHDVKTCFVQLRALGLIRESVKKRSVHDKGRYWILTPYGDNLMVQLRALKRPESQLY